ncbi:hypothetical protein H8B15_07905 [Hymenobacter sp. BT507]|uniref:Uncharacterized protein n=1 Tax=Hymenobacter citatus TaxID=2763506 RepID=A0ABR7MJW5_9BACT|nr:hypothetical protein [Hymenobacter citatus]MBC6610843.1 hypothetical protein [Hymenobacter citatus]
MADFSSPYNPSVGSPIPLDTAAKWTKKYQQEHPEFDEDGVAQEPTYATFFGRKAINKLMKRWGKRCVGIRIYQGIDDTDPTTTNRRRVVLVAVDKHGNDLLDVSECEDGSVDDPVLDEGLNCPDHCSDDSPLIQ